MSKEEGGWGTDCEAQLEYNHDNYYLLIWNDPNCMEIRNTKQVISALAVSLVEGESRWEMHTGMGHGSPSENIKELMDHLNADQEGSARMPSNNYVSDECGYVYIRRIHAKYE